MNRQNAESLLGEYLHDIVHLPIVIGRTPARFDRSSLTTRSLRVLVERFFDGVGSMAYTQPQPDVFSTPSSSKDCMVVSDSFVFTAKVLQVVHPSTSSFFKDRCPGRLFVRDAVLLKMTDVFFMNATRPTDREVEDNPLSRYAMIE
ncbi:unnamed protein product, partial [Ectocarpus sp. 4 AP-2014]